MRLKTDRSANKLCNTTAFTTATVWYSHTDFELKGPILVIYRCAGCKVQKACTNYIN